MKHKPLSLITTALLFLCTLTGHTQNFWEPLGAPGGVNTHALAVTTDGTIYVGGSSGTSTNGVYRLTPGGTGWEYLGLRNSIIGSIEIIPTGDILVGANDTIFRSVNNGNTWDTVYTEKGNWAAIKAFGNGLVLAGNASGGSGVNSVLRSLDNGETWDTVFQVSGNEAIYDFARTPDGTIYMGTTHYFNGGGVYRSPDNGTTWEYIGLPDKWIMTVAVNSSGEVFAGANAAGIYKYNGSGTSWTLLKNNISAVKMIINSQGNIFAACNADYYPGGILRSEDNGQTFEVINSGLLLNGADLLAMDGTGYIYTGMNNYPCIYRSTESTNIIHTILDGTITYANADSTPLSNTHVTLMQGDSIIRDTTTNAEGFYQLKNFPYGSYTMECSPAKPWGGVTASDVLLYRKHIAHIINLDGIYLDSGDVNGSGDVTAADVLLIRKRIAHLIDAFPAGDWLFNNQPVMITTSHMTYNFSGICYGDANGSYVPQ